MFDLSKFWREERGQDVMEYGVLAAFISVAAVAIIRTIGPLIAALFAAVLAALS